MTISNWVFQALPPGPDLGEATRGGLEVQGSGCVQTQARGRQEPRYRPEPPAPVRASCGDSPRRAWTCERGQPGLGAGAQGAPCGAAARWGRLKHPPSEPLRPSRPEGAQTTDPVQAAARGRPWGTRCPHTLGSASRCPPGSPDASCQRSGHRGRPPWLPHGSPCPVPKVTAEDKRQKGHICALVAPRGPGLRFKGQFPLTTWPDSPWVAPGVPGVPLCCRGHVLSRAGGRFEVTGTGRRVRGRGPRPQSKDPQSEHARRPHTPRPACQLVARHLL